MEINPIMKYLFINDLRSNKYLVANPPRKSNNKKIHPMIKA